MHIHRAGEPSSRFSIAAQAIAVGQRERGQQIPAQRQDEFIGSQCDVWIIDHDIHQLIGIAGLLLHADDIGFGEGGGITKGAARQ